MGENVGVRKCDLQKRFFIRTTSIQEKNHLKMNKNCQKSSKQTKNIENAYAYFMQKSRLK